MPIQYRCPACDQLLSIATRKAGHEVPCPQCGGVTVVPQPEANEGVAVAGPELHRGRDTDEEPSGAVGQASATAVPPPPAIEVLAPQRLFEDSLSGPYERAADSGHSIVANESDGDVDQDAGGFQIRRSNPNIGDLDLTSMVDVTFLLLIFFMVTASFSLIKTIELPPPKQDQKGAAQSLSIEDLQANTIFVKIDERNAIFVDDVPAGNPAELADVLTKSRLTTFRTDLAIDAHPEALHETVVLVVDSATAAGMQKIRIVSRSGGND